MIADEFHNLTGKFLTLIGPIADAAVEHQIAKPHNAQTDAAGSQCGFTQLGNALNVTIGINNVIKEADCGFGGFFQLCPVDFAVCRSVLGQID